jgi:hypothetical protein
MPEGPEWVKLRNSIAFVNFRSQHVSSPRQGTVPGHAVSLLVSHPIAGLARTLPRTCFSNHAARRFGH